MKKLIVTFFCVIVGCANLNAMNFSKTENKTAVSKLQQADSILRLIKARTQLMVITARDLQKKGKGATKIKTDAVNLVVNMFQTINQRLRTFTGTTPGDQFFRAMTQLLVQCDQQILQAQCSCAQEAVNLVERSKATFDAQAEQLVTIFKQKFSYDAGNAQVNGVDMNKQLANDLGWRDGSGPGPEATQS